MSDNTLSDLLNFANILADASGAILNNNFKNPFSVRPKADSSPVTQIDIDVEERIRSMILQKFPDHGIIGEETGNVNENAAYRWIIDPIDGTKSFIAGYPIFTTLIALLHENKPVIGLINQPILHERWSAISGHPTLCNNSPLKPITNNKMLFQANIATTSTDYFSPEQAAKFKKLQDNTMSTTLGGDGYAYAMLATGMLDIVVDAALKPYDFCALAPIIEGAGGIISDWSGNPLTLSSDGNVIAAANADLHRQALSLLN